MSIKERKEITKMLVKVEHSVRPIYPKCQARKRHCRHRLDTGSGRP